MQLFPAGHTERYLQQHGSNIEKGQKLAYAVQFNRVLNISTYLLFLSYIGLSMKRT
jgi:hypothetical protein